MPRISIGYVLLLTMYIFRSIGAVSMSIQSGFSQFVLDMGRSYDPGSSEFQQRQTLYELRVAEVAKHNQDPDRLWTAVVNKFSDWTDSELSSIQGWKGHGIPHPASLLELDSGESASTSDSDDEGESELKPLPESKSWGHLKVASRIPDQGSCGSCWAIAANAVLEAHTEIHHNEAKDLSAQEIVSCVPNPHHCGGKGGCEGATVELAFAWVMKNDLSLKKDVPYTAKTGKCKKLSGGHATKLESLSPKSQTSFGMTSFKTLPSNKEEPLARAVVEKGPVAVSVAAANWFSYGGGIFNKCHSWVIDHAVTLYGYGKKGPHKYWYIRNSWGKDWGDDGFIRLLRHENEEKNCGVDHDPSKGIACDGGPSKVTVCGCNGVLYDSVVPTFAKVAAGKSKKSSMLIDEKGNSRLMRHASDYAR
eukprot:TRINITY_DN41335_c0_g1_i1.p1 TRINITY_DN41335_c0_g1~~TRINITY_DN41335_c0_g1_i1.p1  ORF type:complete len:419 (-),score=64.21 TRINITY_DN41335_c0_g1_i1:40-1296(-)